MITIAIFLTLIGFLSCYHSSKKAKFSVHYPIQYWLKDHSKKANYFGVLGMILGLGLCVLSLGWFTGIILFLMTLTLVGSLSILLIPLEILSVKLWSVFFVLLFVLEIYLSYYASK